MLGVLSIVLFLHTIISTLRWRKFMQANQQQFFLPLDIALEIAIATSIALIAILASTNKFKIIKQFRQQISYDASFFKPNFKNYRTSRSCLLLPYLKSKLNSEDFQFRLQI